MNSKRQCDLFGHTASYINTSLLRLAIWGGGGLFEGKLQFIVPFQFVGEGFPLPPHTKNS